MKYLNEYDRFKEYDAICRKYKITDYTINEDGSIDVNQNVDLRDKQFYELPLKFNRINGSFNCAYNKLISLEDCPRYVGGGFFCQANEITSLEGCPEYIGELFYCDGNPINSIVQYFINNRKDRDNLIELFNYYDIVQDMNVIYDRLKYFYEGIDRKLSEWILEDIQKNGYKIIY